MISTFFVRAGSVWIACAVLHLAHAAGQSTLVPSAEDGKTAPEYLATCAASAAEILLLTPQSERDIIKDLETTVGQFYRLACAASSRSDAASLYEQERARVNTAFAKTESCAASGCMNDFVYALHQQLKTCHAYRARHAAWARSIPLAVYRACVSLD